MQNRPFEDVSPIRNGDFPASHVSLLEGHREKTWGNFHGDVSMSWKPMGFWENDQVCRTLGQPEVWLRARHLGDPNEVTCRGTTVSEGLHLGGKEETASG